LRQLARFRSLLLFAGFGKKRVGSALPFPGQLIKAAAGKLSIMSGLSA